MANSSSRGVNVMLALCVIVGCASSREAVPPPRVVAAPSSEPSQSNFEVCVRGIQQLECDVTSERTETRREQQTTTTTSTASTTTSSDSRGTSVGVAASVQRDTGNVLVRNGLTANANISVEVRRTLENALSTAEQNSSTDVIHEFQQHANDLTRCDVKAQAFVGCVSAMRGR